MINDIFDAYLKKYAKKFRAGVVIKDVDKIYKIYGKYGEIGPYNPRKNLLSLWYMDRHKLKTNTRRRNIILKQLEDLGVNYHFIAEGDIEFGIKFDEPDLHKVCEAIKATAKIKLTQAQKNERIQRINGKSSSANRSIINNHLGLTSYPDTLFGRNKPSGKISEVRDNVDKTQAHQRYDNKHDKIT